MVSLDDVFVAVHVGAGYHSKSKEYQYKAAVKKACEVALKLLRSGRTSLEAAVAAIEILENDPCTNAGCGSNLNLDGYVECDASIMSGDDGAFGAVGAVRGIKNPISVAAELLKNSRNHYLSAGRIPPIFLSGDGAHKWALDNGCQTFDLEGSDLITGMTVAASSSVHFFRLLNLMVSTLTDESLRRYKSHMHILQTQNEQEIAAAPRAKNTKLEEELLDTVGVVCMDHKANLVAGVSSGGISLKFPGRVGEAAMYGTGCWAVDPTLSSSGIGVSATGTGEHLMRALISKSCVDKLLSQADAQSGLFETLRNFCDSPFLTEEKNAGLLVGKVTCLNGENGDKSSPTVKEIFWGHTTPSMILGYQSVKKKSPMFVFSRLNANEEIKIGAVSI
ncbi:nucleophile aminohydrolase [Paraphysoderma sedebokerense]|nr:nucleophile aminohydrolase [Paraphysoderma sedebokerense]